MPEPIHDISRESAAFGILVLHAVHDDLPDRSTIVDRALGTSFKTISPATGLQVSMGYGYVYTIVGLALFLPGISVLVRRLHDTDRSGWWYWIALIPLIGVIVLLVWFCSRGTLGDNKYGFDPLAGGLAQTFS